VVIATQFSAVLHRKCIINKSMFVLHFILQPQSDPLGKHNFRNGSGLHCVASPAARASSTLTTAYILLWSVVLVFSKQHARKKGFGVRRGRRGDAVEPGGLPVVVRAVRAVRLLALDAEVVVLQRACRDTEQLFIDPA
jgi:hypothetical protein